MFEIVKTAHGYASTPITLVSFNNTNGSDPHANLIIDAKGDLFGTTELGGANRDGTVFEIPKTAHGYASTPTTLLSFNGTNGSYPEGGLFADANGDLFGTTSFAGANNDGTVFEVTNSGFKLPSHDSFSFTPSLGDQCNPPQQQQHDVDHAAEFNQLADLLSCHQDTPSMTLPSCIMQTPRIIFCCELLLALGEWMAT